MTIQIKALVQYFPVVLFIMLYKVVLTFESVDETIKCYHSNKSSGAVLSGGAVYLKKKNLTNEYFKTKLPRMLHAHESKKCSPVLATKADAPKMATLSYSIHLLSLSGIVIDE